MSETRISYEGMGLTPEQESLDRRDAQLCDALAIAGWDFGGVGPRIGTLRPGEVSLGIVLSPEVGELSMEDAARLLPEAVVHSEVKDDEEELRGWTILPPNHPDCDGRVGIDYQGPVDETFEQGVASLVGFLQGSPQ